MPKNKCAGMSQTEIIAALGIPKSTYYDYIDDPDYPLNADFVTQNAWVDQQQIKSGAKADPDKSAKGKGKDPREPNEKEVYELKRLKAQTRLEEQKLSESIEDTIAGAQVYLVQRTQRILDRLGEVIQDEICPECSKLLRDEYLKAVAEIDKYEKELCHE